MAFSVKDVVENRVSQRAPGVRRDLAASGSASQVQRQRFSLEDVDPRAGSGAPPRATADARSNAAKPNAARPDAVRRQPSEPPTARSKGEPKPEVSRAEPTASDATKPQVVAADTSDPDVVESGAVSPEIVPQEGNAPIVDRPTTAKPISAATLAPQPEVVELVGTEAPEAGPDTEATQANGGDEAQLPDEPPQATAATLPTSISTRATRAEAPPKPLAGKASIAKRPDMLTGETAVSAGAVVAGSADENAQSTKDADEVARTDEAGSSASSEATATPLPFLAIFAAPPPPTQVPAGSAAQRAASTTETEIGAADSPTPNAAVESSRTGPNRSFAAANAGFDAALAESGLNGAADTASAVVAPPNVEPTTPSGTTATTEVKAAAAAQPQTPSAPTSAPVPLGAVPMTIGLRALGASNRFEIRLDPKELGRIDVSIDIDKDSGTVGARLVVDRPETLALLQRDASSLQQALAQTGLDASSGISLSLRGGEGDRPRSGQEPGADGQYRGGPSDRTGGQTGPDQTPIDLLPIRPLRGFGRVDIRI